MCTLLNNNENTDGDVSLDDVAVAVVVVIE